MRTQLEITQELLNWNALLQNAIRAPIDHGQVRELIWKMADLEQELHGNMEAQAVMEPGLPQDSVMFCEHPAFEP